MPTQDTSEIKEKIIGFLRIKGPSLPIHVAKEIRASILLTSVFLSELLAERRLKMSNMKIGSSSLYFIEGQELRLADFAEHLKSKEKEAFLFLKEKRFLKDREQEPAIRVALRAIKDFAATFNRDGELVWRYFSVPESELPKEPIVTVTEKIEEKPKEEKITEKAEIETIFDKKLKLKSKKIKKVPRKRVQSQEKNEKFFNRIKEFLLNKSIEIMDIEWFSKKDLALKVRTNGEEKLLVAYDKKRINEADMIKANKRASELGLKYIILSLGELSKKLKDLVEATKNLVGIEKIE